MPIAQSVAVQALVGTNPQVTRFILYNAAYRALAGYPCACLLCFAALVVEPEQAVIVSAYP